MPHLFSKLTVSTKRIFLIDGIGALLTAFLLLAILRTFNEYFGMPLNALDFLSVIALIFSVYSFCCFFLIKNNWRLFLQVIIIANLLYCFLTAGLVIFYYPQLTILAVIYFLLEIVVVFCLVFFEINVLIENPRNIKSGNE
ncbi:hypothetical protein [Flavihumibacter fluvii]|uniref:hypothetical protein n=1 Tax=Flavihumibacter fluvii TaxID=2838157 RepID=UPI001BDEE492|nr:hypothetical protein [Flavihumibacter fluvii]ULQ51769.1 hypothetical protein KJS93_16905 [Flavihumibacter fluvii]